MPEAPGGGHRTQLVEPDETAPPDDEVGLPAPVLDDRPEEPPDGDLAAPLVVAPVLVPIAFVVVPAALVVDVVVPVLVVVAEVVLLAVVVVAGVAGLEPDRAGSTTALRLGEEVLAGLPAVDWAVCAVAGRTLAADNASASAAARIMIVQRGRRPRVPPVACRSDTALVAALLGSPRVFTGRKPCT